MKELSYVMPAVALRGMTILPGMIAHFDISRKPSLQAVETAMMGNEEIYLITQKDVKDEEPKREDLYEIGVVAKVRQVIKLQNNIVRVLVEGTKRAKLLELTEREEYLEAQILVFEAEEEDD